MPARAPAPTIPARAPLSRERVVRAAIALADRDGVADLSMRRLGAELRVEAMSLYRYFPNKRALLEAIVETLYGEVDVPREGEPWQAGLRRFAASWRAMATRHARIAALLVTAGRGNPGVVRVRAAVQGALRRAGFDEDATFQAECTIVGYTMGLTMLSLGPDAFALDTEAAQADPRSRGPVRDAERDFQFGLEAVIRGLESTLPAPAPA